MLFQYPNDSSITSHASNNCLQHSPHPFNTIYVHISTTANHNFLHPYLAQSSHTVSRSTHIDVSHYLMYVSGPAAAAAPTTAVATVGETASTVDGPQSVLRIERHPINDENIPIYVISHHYCLHRRICRKVMFSQASVCSHVGGVKRGVPYDHYP